MEGQTRILSLIGHEGHPEVEGTMGRYSSENGNIYLVQDIDEAKKVSVNQPNNLAYVSQTTLSVDETKDIINELTSKFPNITGPKKDDICYATQNRQDAVKQLALETDFIIVVGSKASSNSNRLKELANKCGVSSVLIDEFSDLDLDALKDCKNIGLTAGASAPESKIQEIIKNLCIFLDAEIDEIGGVKENISFKLPPELRAS